MSRPEQSDACTTSKHARCLSVLTPDVYISFKARAGEYPSPILNEARRLQENSKFHLQILVVIEFLLIQFCYSLAIIIPAKLILRVILPLQRIMSSEITLK